MKIGVCVCMHIYEPNSIIFLMEIRINFLIETMLSISQALGFDSPDRDTPNSFEEGGHKCKHDFMLNEEIGLTCRLCNHVSIEIKYVSQPFVSTETRKL